ncbi:hypothetical protein [Solimonas flava]|uniref:hypothetical protein n=1 Tax=Solimonas flava TaxID=415849 RepID=UPI0003F99951|nr:hypothetical protein [Solimonas flava]
MSIRNRPRSPPRLALRFEPEHDDPEQIERIIELGPGFPYVELVALAKMLEADDVFVPGYLPPKIGLCHPNSIIYERDVDSIRHVLFIDRNIASRMAQIVSGTPMNDMLRKVAAIKAFSHFLDIEIEPSIAFHELAHSQGNDAANRELARFLDADNDDPDAWLDLAFGDLEALQPRELQHQPESHDFNYPLRRWQRNYVIALKMAELELSDRRNLDRILDLLSWMRNEFIIVGPAAMLASVYFAPNSARRKGLLKQLRSPVRRRAIDGVRNAAWDLTHLGDLIAKVNEAYGSKVRILFASLDDGLRDLARLISKFPEGRLSTTLMAQALIPNWNSAEAEQIAEVLVALIADVNDERRKASRAIRTAAIDDLIATGEQRILSTT